MATLLDVISASLQELNEYAPGEAIDAVDAQFGLDKANLLLDTWATDEFYVYNKDFTVYPITPNLQPHTIGPSGATFTVTQRPEKIETGNLVLNNVSPSLRIPLNIRDDAWWAGQSIRGLSTTTPTDLYYSPAFPNGQIFLWPVPTVAYQLEIETWVLISQFVTIGDAFNVPPGYRNAITLTLAEDMAGAFGAVITPTLAAKAQKARTAIQSVNIQSPRMGSSDAGVPRSGKARPTWNFRTGWAR